MKNKETLNLANYFNIHYYTPILRMDQRTTEGVKQNRRKTLCQYIGKKTFAYLDHLGIGFGHTKNCQACVTGTIFHTFLDGSWITFECSLTHFVALSLSPKKFSKVEMI